VKNFERALRYESWANRRVLACLREHPGETRGWHVFAHVLAAQELWLARLRGEDSDGMEVWPEWGPDQCQEALDRAEAGLAEFERGLGPELLERRVSYRNTKGTPYTTRVHDILRHLNRHGVYHRGQVALAVRLGGGSPVNTDYIAWVRELEGQPLR
jgi:uncharacterized damage-inducible protein DinB